MNRYKSNKTSVPLKELYESGKKIQMSHRDMDLIEHAVYGNFGESNPNINPKKSK